MTEAESIGTARIDVTVNTATMETGVEAAKRKVSGLGAEAAAQFDKANASTKRYAESLLRQADLLGKSRAEQIAYNAQVKIGGELGAQIAKKVLDRAAALDQERIATIQAAEAQKSADSLRAAAAEEANRRVQQQMALQDRQWAQIRAAFADEQRLAAMRADAAHAFGPELAARERETAEIARSNGVRDRLNAFLATERGQRILDAEAIRNQSKAYTDNVTALRQTGSAATAAATGTTKSAKELEFALRGVPAQITDIVTGLATGQRPLSVFLQQGGQLKDMFGGIGPAAKALGTSLLGLINPATLLAGAAVALFAAWKSGSDEQVAFQKALINTGNYAGLTTQQLQGLSQELSRTSGTQHDAAAVLAEVAGSGKFTSDQLRLVASAAIAAGDGADDMVAKFAKLADDPVKASVELNSTYHYLTASVYEQIKALEDQGRTQDAARLAMETYSTAVVSRSRDVKENLSLIERSWNGITDATKRAIDAARNFGRAQTDQEKFDVLFENRDAAKKLIDRGMGSTAFLGKTAQQYYDDATKQLGAMQDAQVAAQKKASHDAAVQQANDAAISLAQQAQQYESDEAKRTREIAAIHQQANDAIAKATLAGDKDLAAKIRASEAAAVAGIMSKGPKATAEKDLTIDVSTGWKEMVAQIEKGIAADKKEIEQRARATVELNSYREALQQRLATDKQALDLQVQSLGMGQHQIDIQRQLIDIQKDADRELARLNDPSNRRTLTDDEYQARLSAIKDYEDQRVQLVYDADAKLQAARSDWTNGARRAIADIAYDASDTATQFANLVQGTYGSLSDFIVDAATTGKASIKDLVSSILKEVARLEANKAAATLISYGVGLFTGGGYGGTNGQGGLEYNSQGFVSHVNAKGGVYTSPDLSQYSGQIVDRPTTFAFARGAGLMGEAGPEAIMPLTRTADGKLGIKSAGPGGGGVQINVQVNVDSSGNASSKVDAGSADALGRELADQMRSVAEQTLSRSMQPGGKLYRAGIGAGR